MLSWSQVEKRIGELIRTDRYLNPKEKERYPQWLESQEERRAKIEEMKRNREILSNAPPEQEVEPTEKEPEEAEQPQDVEYELSLIHIYGEIKNISFGLYAAEDIVSASGTVIPADGLIEIVSVMKMELLL